MAANFSYSYFRVSKTEGLNESAQNYRALRLRALKASPNSFSSTYETEVAFANSDWIDRLTAPDREVFICAAIPLDHGKSPKSVNWIGQVTLRGPLPAIEFSRPEGSGQTPVRSDEEDEERWQMLSLFVLPDHRGNRIGSNLCLEALNYLRSYRSSPPLIHVRLMVKPDNHVTVKLYQRLGFVQTGKCTLAEALVANGDGHLLPSDLSTAKYSDRTGLVMNTCIHR